MDCSTPGFRVHHQLPELAQIMSFKSVMPSSHLILCRPLLLLPSIFSSIRVFSNESILHTGGQSMGASALAWVLPMNIQDWFPLRLTGLMSLQSKGLSRLFSNTTVQKRQFFGAQLSLWSNFRIHTWLLINFYHRNNFNVALELHWVGQKVCLGSSLEPKSGLTLLEQYYN